MKRKRSPIPLPVRRLLRRAQSQLVDDRGAVMLEFVLVAPIMCYLIASVLFFQSNLDYAQDQIMKTRQKTWEKALPGTATTITSGEASDDAKFFLGIPFRPAIDVPAALYGATNGVGGLLAAARYIGGDHATEDPPATPYDALELKRKNYLNDYITPDSVPVTGWAKMMGGFGQWFGNKIGTGAATTPDGLTTSKWKDRYSMTVEPWMREYSDELDPSHYGLGGLGLSFADMSLVWDVLDLVPNANRAPINRFDKRDDIDIGENAPDSVGFALISQFTESSTCDQLKLTTVSSSVDSIVK